MELSRSRSAGASSAALVATRDRDLVAAADQALRTTLGASIRAPHCDGEVAGPGLRGAVRALCAEAHRRGVNAEDVIIAVKQAWASLTELTARPGEASRGETLRHFISTCIDEFYAGEPFAQPSGRPTRRDAAAAS